MMAGVDVRYASHVEDVLAVALPRLVMRPQPVEADLAVVAAA